METISLPFASFVFQTLGLPGLIFIVWWWDHKAQVKQREIDQQQHAKDREEYAKEREAHAKELAATLAQYREDVGAIKQLYKNNVELVNDYDKSQVRLEKLYQETLSVIALNTQTVTHLVSAINTNQYCPEVRAVGPKR